MLSRLCNKSYHREPKGSPIYSAQQLSYVQKSSLSCHQKTKVSCLGHSGTARAEHSPGCSSIRKSDIRKHCCFLDTIQLLL